MAEVDISPLAKRLAEENNVDWRALGGSGDDGRIVERDVLDYLARVMAGDEAADPTPEPLPDGMRAWPEQPPMESEGGGWAAEEQPDTATASGDDDLLEVESADVAPSSGSDDWSQGEWGAGDWGSGGAASADGEDDFFAGMSDLGGEHSATFDENGFDFGSDDGDRSFEFGSETESQAYECGGAAEKSSDFDFGAESAGEDRSVFDTSSMEPAIDEGIFVFDDDEPAQAATAGDSGSAESVSADSGHDEAEASTEAGGTFDFSDGDSGDTGTSFEFGGEENSAAEDTEHTPWEGAGATAPEVEEELAAADLEGGNPWEQNETQAPGLASSDAPWTAVSEEPAPATDAPASATAAADYDYLDRAEESLPDGVRLEEDEYRVVRSGNAGAAAVGAVETVETATSPQTSAPPARGVVSSGIVLRREVDVTAVIEASRALSAELDGEPSLEAFLLRAAARGGRPWPLAGTGDEVGLATLSDDGVRVSVVNGAGDMQFRDLIGAASGATDESGTAALAVADVSGMGIDEAVLDLGSPVLTIGRVSGSDGGGLHATLTLSGLSASESGSQFLGRVAELLAAPVRLVL